MVQVGRLSALVLLVMRLRGPLAVSVGVHGILIAALLWLPAERGAQPSRVAEWTEVELLESLPSRGEAPRDPVRDPVKPPPAEAARTEPTDDTRTSEQPSTPTPSQAPSRPSTDRSPKAVPSAAGVLDTDPASTSEGPDADDAAVVVPPASTGVALLGLRGGAHKAGPVVAPQLPAGSVAVAPRPGPAVAMPDPADAEQIRTPAQAGFKRTKDGRLVFNDPDPGASWSAELLPDGRVKFSDDLRKRFDPMAGLPERLMASRGIRFWIKRKQRLLAATRPMRLNMAVDFAEKNIDRQLLRLHRDLLAIWASDKPPRTRRGLLFDVWDECEESVVVNLGEFTDSEPTKMDALRSAAGVRARRTIIAFVKRHLPKGHKDAYPDAELTALNSRRLSRDRFAPYQGA